MGILNDTISLLVSVLTLLGILSATLAVIIKRRKGKSTKTTEVLEVISEVTDKGVEMIKLIPDLVARAEEQYGKGHGANKLDYVLTKLQLYALQNGVKYDEENVKSYVENIITTTKNVNVYGGDKK